MLAILFIFIVALLRSRGHESTRLPAPMMFAIRITLGIIFIILGIIGAFVPIMQGWIFMLLAALVLFPQSRFAIKSLDKIEKRAPRMVAWLRKMGVGVHRTQ